VAARDREDLDEVESLGAEISRRLGSMQSLQLGVALILGSAAAKFDAEGTEALLVILVSMGTLAASVLIVFFELGRSSRKPLFRVRVEDRRDYIEQRAEAIDALNKKAKFSVWLLIAAVVGTALSAMLVLS
jgi:anaerobic C4-dicarboxylate transporter